MVMYSTYYDASGSQNLADKPLVVVGLLSTEEKWLKCEREWDQALEEFEVPYLHMKEFAPGAGPFESWKDDKPRRAEFLERLIKVLKRRVNIVFQYRLVPEIFRKLDLEYTLTEEWGGPYALICGITIRVADDWFERHYPGDRLKHIVEKGDAGQGQLIKQTLGFPNPPLLQTKVDPTTRRHFVPFQAADLLAYEARVNIQRHLAGEEQKVRESLSGLRKQIPHCAHFADEEVLRNVITQQPAIKPRIAQ